MPKVGDSFSLGEAVVTVLGPVPGKQYEDPNDTSLVLHIVYGETSFLFTGDIEEPAQRDLLESGVIPHATLLKVPHHGKASAATKAFLDAVNRCTALLQTQKRIVCGQLRRANGNHTVQRCNRI